VQCQDLKLWLLVIPAQAGIQIAALDSRLRGNDGTRKSIVDDAGEVVSKPGQKTT
jgi:hypothetical protein